MLYIMLIRWYGEHWFVYPLETSPALSRTKVSREECTLPIMRTRYRPSSRRGETILCVIPLETV